MAQLGRAATDQDILVSEHGRRFGIIGDGAAGDPSALMLDGKVIASNRLTTPFIAKIITALAAAGAVTLTGTQPGDTVVSVTDLNGTQTDTSANFESTITVAGQIQQLNATPNSHVCFAIVWPRS
jgi:hypothetical protein